MKKIVNQSTGLLLMRIALGGVFAVHGIQKFQNMNETVAYFNSLGFHAVFAWIVAITETVGGIGILLGVWTTLFGVLLAIVMLVALAKVHLPLGLMKSEFPLALFAMALGLASTGPGRYSVATLCGCGTCMICKDTKNTCDASCDCDCKK